MVEVRRLPTSKTQTMATTMGTRGFQSHFAPQNTMSRAEQGVLEQQRKTRRFTQIGEMSCLRRQPQFNQRKPHQGENRRNETKLLLSQRSSNAAAVAMQQSVQGNARRKRRNTHLAFSDNCNTPRRIPQCRTSTIHEHLAFCHFPLHLLLHHL